MAGERRQEDEQLGRRAASTHRAVRTRGPAQAAEPRAAAGACAASCRRCRRRGAARVRRARRFRLVGLDGGGAPPASDASGRRRPMGLSPGMRKRWPRRKRPMLGCASGSAAGGAPAAAPSRPRAEAATEDARQPARAPRGSSRSALERVHVDRAGWPPRCRKRQGSSKAGCERRSRRRPARRGRSALGVGGARRRLGPRRRLAARRRHRRHAVGARPRRRAPSAAGSRPDSACPARRRSAPPGAQPPRAARSARRRPGAHLVGPSASPFHSGASVSSRDVEGRLAAHGEAQARRSPGAASARVAGGEQLRPDLVGVGRGRARLVAEAADRHLEADLARRPRRWCPRRGAASAGRRRAGERDVALAAEQAAGGVEPDPAAAGQVDLGPGVQVDDVAPDALAAGPGSCPRR